MKDKETSRLPGFHRLDAAARRREIERRLGEGGLGAGLSLEQADAMIENAVGVVGIPLGVAANFLVNGEDVLVPMAIEEPSVVAAASNAARMAREGGGFVAGADPAHTAAQIEILDAPAGSAARVAARRSEIERTANGTQPELVGLGGGVVDLEIREAVGRPGRLVMHLVVDCLDAMGANMVNTMAEAVSPLIARAAGGRAGLRILTNLADRRLARASCAVPFEALGRRGFSGERVARAVVSAAEFAADDPYRAATHNKGVFNGIDALLLACGNDWRAVEAGGHAWAARGGRYGSLTAWTIEGEALRGELEMPMAVGVVGGAARANPTARSCMRLAGIETAADLARLAVCAGLATNLAALCALGSEGIQRGHMRLHGRRDR